MGCSTGVTEETGGKRDSVTCQICLICLKRTSRTKDMVRTVQGLKYLNIVTSIDIFPSTLKYFVLRSSLVQCNNTSEAADGKQDSVPFQICLICLDWTRRTKDMVSTV